MDKIIISKKENEQQACIIQNINIYDKLECLMAFNIPFKVTPVSKEEFMLLESQIQSGIRELNSDSPAKIYRDSYDALSIRVRGIKFDITRNGKVIDTEEVFYSYPFNKDSMNIYTTENYDNIIGHYGYVKGKRNKGYQKRK